MQRGSLSLNLISTVPSGQVVERLFAGRILSGPILSLLLAAAVLASLYKWLGAWYSPRPRLMARLTNPADTMMAVSMSLACVMHHS